MNPNATSTWTPPAAGGGLLQRWLMQLWPFTAPAERNDDLSPQTPLLTADELTRLQQQVLDLGRGGQQAVVSAYPGPFRSLFRGHGGMELYDVRPYQRGDDIRYMDWRATARSGKPTTKVFLEEHQRSLFLVIDRRATMHFGTRREPKAATAARTAAILIFSALAARERVAGIIIENDALNYFPPARSIETVLPLLQATVAPLTPLRIPRPSGGDRHNMIGTLFAQLERRVEHGASLCLISDYHDMAAEHARYLRYAAQHFETLAIRIIDRAEETLKNTGTIRVISPLSGNSTLVDTSDQTIRQGYAEAAAQRSAELSLLFSSSGIAMLPVYNDKDTFAQLNTLL